MGAMDCVFSFRFRTCSFLWRHCRNVSFFLLFLIGIQFCHADVLVKTTVTVDKAHPLSAVLTPVQQDTCRFLAIKGTLGTDDIRLLRRMARADDGTGRTGRLMLLDLRKAKFATEREPFLVIDLAEEHVVATAMPMRRYRHYIDLKPKHSSAFPSDLFYNFDATGNYSFTRDTVGKFRPRYVIGLPEGKELSVVGKISTWDNGNQYGNEDPMRESKAQYFFAEGITAEDWQRMQQLKMTKFEGHKVVRDEQGVYKMQVCLRKNRFFHETFYGCKELKAVSLPKSVKISTFVFDLSSTVFYSFGKKQYNPDTWLMFYKDKETE